MSPRLTSIRPTRVPGNIVAGARSFQYLTDLQAQSAPSEFAFRPHNLRDAAASLAITSGGLGRCGYALTWPWVGCDHAQSQCSALPDRPWRRSSTPRCRRRRGHRGPV